MVTKEVQELKEILKEYEPVVDTQGEKQVIFLKSGIISGLDIENIRNKFFKIDYIASSLFEKNAIIVSVTKLDTEECDRCEQEKLALEFEDISVPNRDTPYDSIMICRECIKEREHEAEIEHLQERLPEIKD